MQVSVRNCFKSAAARRKYDHIVYEFLANLPIYINNFGPCGISGQVRRDYLYLFKEKAMFDKKLAAKCFILENCKIMQIICITQTRECLKFNIKLTNATVHVIQT